MMFNPYASPYLQPPVSGMQNFPQMQQMPQPPMGGPQQPMGNTQAAPAFLQVRPMRRFWPSLASCEISALAALLCPLC